MAIDILDESEGNVLGIKASGKLTEDDYREAWAPRLEEILNAHGTVRLLVCLDDAFEGFEAGGLWEDTKFGFQHFGAAVRGKFEKMAVVGGPTWMGKVAEIAGHLFPGELESFSSDKLEEAWAWVKA